MRESNCLAIWPALGAACIVWGSTYLGLRYGLEGFPPFILNGVRLMVVGAAVFWWRAARGRPLRLASSGSTRH